MEPDRAAGERRGMISYEADALHAFIAQYNQALRPAPILAWVLCLAALLPTLRRFPGGDRLIGGVLVAAWAWVGIVYQLTYFAAISFLAPVFAALFILQALLFGWTGVVRGRLAFRFRPDAFGWAGLALVALAVSVQPLLAGLAGPGWASIGIVGIAPDPTVVFTIGLLLLVEGRTPRRLLIIPLLWSLIAGATAWVLNLPLDLVPPLAGLAGALLILWKNRWQTEA